MRSFAVAVLGLSSVLLLSTAASGCRDDVVCGDDKIGAGESCDGSELGGASCHTLGYTSGTLGCTDVCLFDVTGCTGYVECGNGQLDLDEQCEGEDLNGQSCESRGLGSGTLACDPFTCQYDTSGCEGAGICGDGIADGDEECDGADLRGATCATVDASYLGGTLDCSPYCTLRLSRCYEEPEFPLGEPCASEADCPGGMCIPEMGWYFDGYPGGYCFERCDDEDTCPLSGEAGTCVDSGWGPSFCFRRCDPAGDDCREGYACVGDSGASFCYPSCTDDTQCLVTGNCDLNPSSDTAGFCVPLPEVCSGGVDEDVDGLVDCTDPDCNGSSFCPLGEDCFNSVDDDGDGSEDCDDGECQIYGHCSGAVCEPQPMAALTCGTTLTGEVNNAPGATMRFSGYECLDPDGLGGGSLWGESAPEYAYTFTVSATALATLTVSNFTGNLDVVVVKEFMSTHCDPAHGCFAFGAQGPGVDEEVIFAAYPTINYYVIVDGRQGNVSTYDISLTCDATGYEECGNGVDDDGDGVVDCNDPECMDVPPDCAP